MRLLVYLSGLFLFSTLLCSSAVSGSVTRQQQPNEIEWTISPASILSLHVFSADEHAPRLFTFDASTTLNDLVHSETFMTNLLGQSASTAATCAMSVISKAGENQLIAPNVPLVTVLNKHSKTTTGYHLQCGNHSSKTQIFTLRQTAHATLSDEIKQIADKMNQRYLKEGVHTDNQEYPMDTLDIVANSIHSLAGWVFSFLKYHWGPLHPFPVYSQDETGLFHLNTGAQIPLNSAEYYADRDDYEEVRIAIAADWGAGTLEADYIGQTMIDSDGFNPDWTIHLGDVYYVGSPDHINANCLGIPPAGVQKGVKWPHGKLGSWSVQGNHEAYDRGFGFFDVWAPTLGIRDPVSGNLTGQNTDYLSLENKYWRVIHLDTGYNTYSFIPPPFSGDNRNNTQPAPVIEWLKNVVNISNPNDNRGIIILSHHQTQSAFEEAYAATPDQLADLLPKNKSVVWLFGHEHRVSWYDPQPHVAPSGNSFTHFSRCIGNSGYPPSISPIPARAREAGLVAYDDRVYQLAPGLWNMTVGFNGFMRVTLKKNQALLEYLTLEYDPNTGRVSNTTTSTLVQEVFEAVNGNVQHIHFQVINPNITVVQSP